MANTTEQYNLNVSSKTNGKFLNLFLRIMKILKKFEDSYQKRLNFTKLAQYLHLTPSDVGEVIGLILQFQELFSNTFDSYIVKKKIIDNQIFLITEPKVPSNIIPKKIRLSVESLNLLSDITYMFKFVKRGKGFDVKANGTELLSNIKELWNYYPYLFEVNTNGLMYPSAFGLKLGELILSYKKSGKFMESFSLDNHNIMVRKT